MSIYGGEPSFAPSEQDKTDTTIAATGSLQVLGKRVPVSTVVTGIVCLVVGVVIGDAVGPACPEAPLQPSAQPGAVPPPALPLTSCNSTIATVSASTTHVDYADTSNDVFASVIGSRGSSAEVLVSHGFNSRSTYNASIAVVMSVVGVPDRINIRLGGNDGVHLGEVECRLGDDKFVWIDPLWLDGDNPAVEQNHDFNFAEASAHLGDSGTRTMSIKVWNTDWQSVSSMAQRTATVYGSLGHVGPLTLTNPTDGPLAQSNFNVPDIGNISAVRVYNNGPGPWELEALEVSLQAPAEKVSWTDQQYLVSSDSSIHGASLWTFYLENAILPPQPGEAMTMLELYVSSHNNAQTHDSIYVTLNTAAGPTQEMSVTSHGLDARQTLSKPLYHQDLGPIQGLVLRSSGNDGVHLDEVRLISGNNELLWLLAGYAHNGWLDGNGDSQGIITLDAHDASIHLDNTEPTINLDFRTITAPEAAAGISSATDIELIVFGTGGHFGPVTLPSHDYTAGGESQSAISVPSTIGNLIAVKLYNTGRDGWMLDELEVQLAGNDRLLWSYGLYIDAGGNGPSAPSTAIFYVSQAIVLTPNLAATLVTLETSSVSSDQTSEAVGISLTFADQSTTPIVNTTGGLHERTQTQVVIQHSAELQQLQSVNVKVFGGDSVHLSEIRADFGFGSSYDAEYAWLLSELTGWLDAESSAVTNQRSYNIEQASPVVTTTGTTRLVTITTLTASSSNSQSSSTFLVSFWFEHGHVPPQVLANNFGQGDSDQFVFDLPYDAGMGALLAIKIVNTGNDGWKCELMSIIDGSNVPVIFAYNQWIDGNGASAQQPKSEIFFTDGTWASQGGLSSAEVQRECPTQYEACESSNSTSGCLVQLHQTLLTTMSNTAIEQQPSWSGEMNNIFSCVQDILNPNGIVG